MADPLTVATGAAAGATGVTFAALFPEATPAVMLCALAGASLYILTADSHRMWKQIIFALISFIGGVYFAETAAEIIAILINGALKVVSADEHVKVTPAIGALVASTVSVTVLLRVLRKSGSYKPDLPGGGKDAS